MSKFITTLQQDDDLGAIGLAGYVGSDPARSQSKKVLTIAAAVFLSLALVGIVGAYLYWQGLKATPQFSLALIIDAARNDDQESVDRLVDTSAVVDDFMPQIISKAVEMYARGLPPQTIARVAEVAEPVMPAVKDRARSELPGVIRKKSARFASVPFAAMVIGAGRYLEIDTKGDNANVKSRLPGHSFDVKMVRDGAFWKVVGVTDSELSEKIARAIGQEVISAATNKRSSAAGERLGIKDLNQLLKNAEEALK